MALPHRFHAQNKAPHRGVAWSIFLGFPWRVVLSQRENRQWGGDQESYADCLSLIAL